jgi:hypothetical protein
MSTWLAVVLSGSVFPSPTVRDSDLVSDHPPPPDDDDDDGAADAASDPAEATADATLALIACAAVVDDARMFEVRPERIGKATRGSPSSRGERYDDDGIVIEADGREMRQSASESRWAVSPGRIPSRVAWCRVALLAWGFRMGGPSSRVK